LAQEEAAETFLVFARQQGFGVLWRSEERVPPNNISQSRDKQREHRKGRQTASLGLK